MNFWYGILLCALIGGVYGQECQTCLKGGSYCEDATNYRICNNGKPAYGPYACPSGKVCTNSTNVCETKGSLPAGVAQVCTTPDAGSCNVCGGDAVMTCVAPSTFAMCFDKTQIQDCAANEVCSLDAYKKYNMICVPSAALVPFGVTQTCAVSTIPPEAPSDEDLQTMCTNAFDGTKTYFNTANCNDIDCTSYIYCEKIGSLWYAIFSTCPTGFFDPDLNVCVSEKPDNCDPQCAAAGN